MSLKTIKHVFLAYVVLNTFVYKSNQNSSLDLAVYLGLLILILKSKCITIVMHNKIYRCV